MPAGWLLKHQQNNWCGLNMQMQWKSRDVAIASQYEGVTFSLTGEYDAECMYGVETFK